MTPPWSPSRLGNLIGRSPVACDYDAAACLVAFAEQETGPKMEV